MLSLLYSYKLYATVGRCIFLHPVGRGLAPAAIQSPPHDCHSEQFFPDELTKNLDTQVTFEILRGLVFAGLAQNDTTSFLFFLFSERGKPVFRYKCAS